MMEWIKKHDVVDPGASRCWWPSMSLAVCGGKHRRGHGTKTVHRDMRTSRSRVMETLRENGLTIMDGADATVERGR